MDHKSMMHTISQYIDNSEADKIQEINFQDPIINNHDQRKSPIEDHI